EGELLKRAEAEIAKEKELVQAGGLEQARALEEEYREKLAAASRRHADVEQSLARRRQELEAEGSGQSARLQLAHAVKEKALEEAAQTKLVELQEEFLRKEAQLSDEWTRRKVDLLSEQQRAIEAEIQAKKIELEQRSNALEEGYRARVAELERAHVALDEQFRMWKATAQADTARREKSLEQRYFLREQELSRGHEMTLEAERRTARLQAQEAKEQFEAMRESLLKESFAREEAAKSAYEKLERQLKDDHDQRERELDAKYRAELDEAVVRHRDLMAQQARHFENEASRREEEFRRELAAHQESRQSERLELEHRLANAEAELGAARERVAKSEGEHHGLFEDLLARERTLEAERADAERQVKQRDQERERKYLALESELQALWTKKEREYLEAHREALTRAQAQFAEALAAEEQTRRAEREAHERALAAQEERQQSRVVQWQEQTLADVAHEKEEWLERQRRAIEHEREILRRQTSEGFELEKAATLEEQRAGLQAEWSKRGSELEKQWKAREEALAAKAEERERELKREFERRHEDLQAQSREGLQEMAKALEREREQAKAELARQAREAEQTLVGAERAFKERTARVEGEAADREAALRDASARREAELQEAALRLRDELKAASAAPAVMDPAARHEKEFNDLVFGIAHQVRNPLGIIQSLAEERRGDFWASRRQKEAAEVTLRAVRSLEARLEQLIEYARPLALKHAPVEPGRLFEKAAAQTGEACRRQGIDVSRPAQAGLAPGMADAERLRDALARLAENAVDAMPHGGTLTLAARAAAGCLELEIADTGRGIEPKQLREVGRPFFTTKPGGLGLGLAIARRVVEAHGGTLEIESERGKGTRVVCRLPLKA
ncbi:MAG: ATP-binding protein, partial [Elusimicrobia bacterium]|nr:ATP-binding protein [Elusimicrobiota bacterium]